MNERFEKIKKQGLKRAVVLGKRRFLSLELNFNDVGLEKYTISMKFDGKREDFVFEGKGKWSLELIEDLFKESFRTVVRYEEMARKK